MKIRSFIAIAVLTLLAAPLYAQQAALVPIMTGNVANVEAGFPTNLVGIDTTPTGQMMVGVAGTYTNDSAFLGEVQSDLWTALIQANYGVMDNVQVFARMPLVIGEGRVPGNFDTTLAARMRLVDEADWLPAFGLQLAGRTPTGHGYTAYDGTITGIFAKRVADARVYANASYTTIGDNVTADRNDSDEFALGVDFAVTDNMLVILDIFTRESRFRGVDRVEMVEAGIRTALTEMDTLSLGLGVGIGGGNATPDFAITAGFQRLF